MNGQKIQVDLEQIKIANQAFVELKIQKSYADSLSVQIDNYKDIMCDKDSIIKIQDNINRDYASMVQYSKKNEQICQSIVDDMSIKIDKLEKNKKTLGILTKISIALSTLLTLKIIL